MHCDEAARQGEVTGALSASSATEPEEVSLGVLGRTLPADLPPELAQVARAVCLADLDRQFEFGLQALLTGIEA